MIIIAILIFGLARKAILSKKVAWNIFFILVILFKTLLVYFNFFTLNEMLRSLILFYCFILMYIFDRYFFLKKQQHENFSKHKVKTT